MVWAHIYYSGTVQGIGFRFTAQRYAQESEVEGWVRNLPDGRVEMIVDGPQEVIEKFCGRIEAHFEGYILKKDIEFLPSTKMFHGFQIIG